MDKQDIQVEIILRLHDALVEDNWCPLCLGGLDYDWECMKCGYDAYDPFSYDEVR